MKKFLAIILSFVCVFALALTACGDNSGDSTGGTNNEQPGDNNQGSGDNTGDNNQGNGDNTGDNNQGNGDNNQGNEQTHTHTYETTWSYDSQNHWHKATCHLNEKKDEAPHNYANGKCGVCNRPDTYDVGDKFPDFTVETYESSYKESTFSTENVRGKVLVINFWYTTCGVCIDEMPHLEALKKQFGEQIEILALHKVIPEEQKIAQKFISSKGWSDYGIIFGKDIKPEGSSSDKFASMFGFAKSGYPVTALLDQDGVIVGLYEGNVVEFDMETKVYSNKLIPVIEELLAR